MKTTAKTQPQDEWSRQQARNQALIEASFYMRPAVTSEVLPFSLDIRETRKLSDAQARVLLALQTEAARIAVRSLASLAEINELDHLGGALDLIPAFTLTLALSDFENTCYTFEHAHTSIGHYGTLAAYGYVDPKVVVGGFRRGLDIPGHVSWLPGGTELNGGRLGVMVPAAVGQALGLRARHPDRGWVICHCGDAGWISGQALNGFNGAYVHGAPITFVMHRNGIQLSGTNKQIMDRDPRPIIESLGIRIIETPTLLDPVALYDAYRESFELTRQGIPTLIYPRGYRSGDGRRVDLAALGEMYGIGKEVEAFAAAQGVKMDTEIWVPGSLMSYRDVKPMLECIFLVNELPGGVDHHDGHMKGRKLDEVLANPMFQEPKEQQAALAELRKRPGKKVVTKARPAPGTANLVLSGPALAAVQLPPVGKAVSPRAGSEMGYAAVAKAFPSDVFVISCDLDPSTKLAKARSFLAADHQFEMGIEEQVSAIMANGLAVSSRNPQLVVFSTFAAFYEGIAREGFEMWRYQRNLTGSNEGLNATFHLSHVGACTGRDHFSGWSLDWITLAMGYLPYLHRFYAPADARSAFLAVRDLAAHYGGHIIGIPRDNLPVLEKQGTQEPLWEADSPWEAVTSYRRQEGAARAILALGAPAFLAGEAADALQGEGLPTDVHIINGLPLPDGCLYDLFDRYPEGVVTVEDGLIATPDTGLRGFAGMVRTAAYGRGLALSHIGIVDPRIAPSEGHMETWAYFGISTEELVSAVRSL